MALGPHLDLKQTQSLVMTPQLQQAIKLLQYSSTELSDFIAEEIQQNPLLGEREGAGSAESASAEDSGPDSTGESGEDISDSVDYLSGSGSSEADTPLDGDFSNTYDGDIAGAGADHGGAFDGHSSGPGRQSLSDDEDYDPFNLISSQMTLKEHLEAQLRLENLSKIERAIGFYMIDLIEPSGYLATPLDRVSQTLGVELSQVEKILGILQQLEPTGVFARDLAECLRLQLEDKEAYSPAMEALLANLPLVAKREWKKLKRICKVGQEGLAALINEIRQLDPKPGLQFDPPRLEGSVPDVLVNEGPGGSLVVELNPDTIHPLIVNDDLYRRVIKGVRSSEDKDYIITQRQSAIWLIKAVRQRTETILKVSEEIVRQQSGFFFFGVNYLRPLVLRDVATALNLHESTISRVTSNKYLSCSRGTFELKYFFTASIGGADGDIFSAESVRHRIRTLISEEQPDAVLSDDQIVARLQESGIDIARRTVAKYREGMNIPSSLQRKREKTAQML